MNTNSHYKHKINNNHKKNTMTEIVTKQKENNLHIKLDTPIVDPTLNCFNYSYDITTAINTDLTKIKHSIDKVSFCIYRIVHCKNQQNVKHPFLQYLLYKYPPTQGNISNTMIFPFIKIKNNIKKESKECVCLPYLQGSKRTIADLRTTYRLLEKHDKVLMFIHLVNKNLLLKKKMVL